MTGVPLWMKGADMDQIRSERNRNLSFICNGLVMVVFFFNKKELYMTCITDSYLTISTEEF